MAEFMAVLGAFGNVLQSIEGARRLCADIKEFRELSQTIEDTAHQIQTAESIIRKYKASIETRHVEKYDVQILQTQLDDVERTIKQLREKLIKLDPDRAGHSGLRSVKKIISVFLKEEHHNIKQLTARISQSITSLSQYFQAVGYEILDGFSDVLEGMKHQVGEYISFGPGKLRRSSTTPSGDTAVPGSCSLLPYERDENFVGREDILDGIDKKFKTLKSVALCGLGGIGKSQIALEYCHRFINEHPDGNVFWITANSLESLDQGYQDIARALDLPIPDDPGIDASKVVFDWFREESHRPWLVVLDNADALDVFSKTNMTNYKTRLLGHLPHSLVGATLFTTRDKTVGSLLTRPGGLIQIPNMTLPESEGLLKSCLDPDTFDEDDPNIPILLNELDYLPLAIVQAGAYIRQQCLEISDYLEIFRESASSQEELLSHEGATNNRDSSLGDSIMVTWKLSFEEVVKRNKRAADILTMLAVMEAGPFPKDLLKEDKESKKEFVDAIAILQAFSLIQPAKIGSILTLQLHRLVRLAIRKWLADAESLEEHQTQALNLLVERYPSTHRKYWNLCQALHPHALNIFEATASLESCLVRRSEFLCKVGNYEGTQGRYEQSCKRLREAVIVFEKVEGASDPKTLALYRDLGFHLCRHGKFDDAEKYLRSALEGYRDSVGTEHLDYVEVINCMGALYKEMGDFEKAKEHFEHTYSAHHNLYGPTHFETIRSRDSLAVALYSLERFDEAVHHHQANIDNLEDDEDLKIEIEENLAEAFLGLCRFDEAEDLRRAILKKREELFPPKHYETIFARLSLALTLQAKDQFSEAERLGRQAFSEFSDTMGPYHLFTLQVARDLGSILFNAKKFVESEKFYRHALKGHQDIHQLATNHREVLENMGNVAAALRGQGKFAQAEEYGKHVFEMLHKNWGIDDEDTIFRMDALSITLEQQGKYDEAIGFFDEVIQKSPVEEGTRSPGIELCLERREEIWAKKLKEAGTCS